MPPAGGRGKGDILFREREYPPYTPKRTQGALPLDPDIAGFGLEEVHALRNRVPARCCCYTICLCFYYPLPLCLRVGSLTQLRPTSAFINLAFACRGGIASLAARTDLTVNSADG